MNKLSEYYSSAYEAGAQQAMLDAGLVKHADPNVLGHLVQSLSPEGLAEARPVVDMINRPGGMTPQDSRNMLKWLGYSDKEIGPEPSIYERRGVNNSSREGPSGWRYGFGYRKDEPSDFFKVRGGTSSTPTFPEPPLPIPTAEEQKAQMSIPDEDLPIQSTPGPVSY